MEKADSNVVNGQIRPDQAPDDPGPASSQSATEPVTDAAGNRNAGETSNPGAEAVQIGGASNTLRPILLAPRRKVHLTRAVLPEPGALQTVRRLSVRELKGVESMFTPNLSGIPLTFSGLVYKPRGRFENEYQILNGSILNEPRVMKMAKQIAFVPAFCWTTYAVVLMPVKLSAHGESMLNDLRKLVTFFPNFWACVTWDGKTFEVGWDMLDELKQNVIKPIDWPDDGKCLEALGETAFDDLNDLQQANEDVRNLLQLRRVR